MRRLTTLSNSDLRLAQRAAESVLFDCVRTGHERGADVMREEVATIFAEADRRGIALLHPELDAEPEPPSPLQSYKLSLFTRAACGRAR